MCDCRSNFCRILYIRKAAIQQDARAQRSVQRCAAGKVAFTQFFPLLPIFSSREGNIRFVKGKKRVSPRKKNGTDEKNQLQGLDRAWQGLAGKRGRY